MPRALPRQTIGKPDFSCSFYLFDVTNAISDTSQNSRDNSDYIMLIVCGVYGSKQKFRSDLPCRIPKKTLTESDQGLL